MRWVYRYRNWRQYHKKPWWQKLIEQDLKRHLKYWKQGNKEGQRTTLTNIAYEALEHLRDL